MTTEEKRKILEDAGYRFSYNIPDYRGWPFHHTVEAPDGWTWQYDEFNYIADTESLIVLLVEKSWEHYQQGQQMKFYSLQIHRSFQGTEIFGVFSSVEKAKYGAQIHYDDWMGENTEPLEWVDMGGEIRSKQVSYAIVERDLDVLWHYGID